MNLEFHTLSENSLLLPHRKIFCVVFHFLFVSTILNVNIFVCDKFSHLAFCRDVKVIFRNPDNRSISSSSPKESEMECRWERTSVLISSEALPAVVLQTLDQTRVQIASARPLEPRVWRGQVSFQIQPYATQLPTNTTAKSLHIHILSHLHSSLWPRITACVKVLVTFTHTDYIHIIYIYIYIYNNTLHYTMLLESLWTPYRIWENVSNFNKIREIIQNACYFLFTTVLSKIFHIKNVYI